MCSWPTSRTTSCPRSWVSRARPPSRAGRCRKRNCAASSGACARPVTPSPRATFTKPRAGSPCPSMAPKALSSPLWASSSPTTAAPPPPWCRYYAARRPVSPTPCGAATYRRGTPVLGRAARIAAWFIPRIGRCSISRTTPARKSLLRVRRHPVARAVERSAQPAQVVAELGTLLGRELDEEHLLQLPDRRRELGNGLGARGLQVQQHAPPVLGVLLAADVPRGDE